MKAYGLPRNWSVGAPDCVDIFEYGLKSSKSRVRGKGGDIKNSFRSSAKKAAQRRIWKKEARNAGKNLCRQIEE